MHGINRNTICIIDNKLMEWGICCLVLAWEHKIEGIGGVTFQLDGGIFNSQKQKMNPNEWQWLDYNYI